MVGIFGFIIRKWDVVIVCFGSKIMVIFVKVEDFNLLFKELLCNVDWVVVWNINGKNIVINCFYDFLFKLGKIWKVEYDMVNFDVCMKV